MFEWIENKLINFFKLPSFTATLPPKRISTLIVSNAETPNTDINTQSVRNAYNLVSVKLPSSSEPSNNIIFYNYYNINKKYRRMVILLDTFSPEYNLTMMLNFIFERLPPATWPLSRTIFSSRCDIESLEKKMMLIKFSPTMATLTEDILKYIIRLCVIEDEDVNKHLLQIIKLKIQYQFTVIFTKKS